jgi:Primase C terminal 2 (PriCT-2)
VIAALNAATNDDIDEELWVRIMASAFVGSAGDVEAYKAFVEWSKKSNKHDPRRTWERWRYYERNPPRKIGPGTLYLHANETAPGWREAYVNEAFESLRADYAAGIAAAKAKPSSNGGRDA